MDLKNFIDNLDNMVERHKALEAELSKGIVGEEFAKLMKEFSDLTPIVEKINAYKKIERQIANLVEMLADKTLDPEMIEMANIEIMDLEPELKAVEQEIKVELLPKGEDDNKNAIIEIRAGTGGDEASLFAADLFLIYQRYAEKQKWKFETLNFQHTEKGGCKEATILISGKNVFAHLQFESGVHRVQRVPETESSGRVHTSAATVAVLPEVEEIDVKIEDKDLKVETCRASGAGGQHVNTTDSAVRMIHIPTGIVVTQQDERSQHQNKQKALRILRARIYEHEKNKRDSVRSGDRKQQVGSGDRSEKIRTYNFPQNRVTDHRINLTIYNLDNVISHGSLDSIIDALISHHESVRLSQIQ
jgi:peptide chain release factor 1